MKNDFRLLVHDWKALVMLLLLPFLFIVFFTYALAPYLDKSSFVEPFSIAVADREDSPQTRIVVKQLEDIDIFKEILYTTEEEAADLIRKGSIAAVLIIPEGFSQSVVHGENRPVTVIGSKAMPLQSFIVKSLLQSAANLVSAGQSSINTIYHYNQLAGVRSAELSEQFTQSTMTIFMEALSRNEIFAESGNSEELDLTPAEYFTAALITVFLLFAGMPAMKMLVTERGFGVSRRLAASPARAWQILLSKFIVSIAVSITQFSVILLLTGAILGNYWGAPAGKILYLLGAVIYAAAAWSILVSAVCRTPSAVDAVGNLGVLLMSVIGGSIYPLSTMPRFIRELSGLTINRWAMDGFMIVFSGNSAASIAGCVWPLLAIGSAMLIMALGLMKLAGARSA